jgi:putative membrane protein
MKKVYFFVVLLLAPVLAIGCGPYGPMGGWEPGHMMNYGFGYGGTFMWVIFLIVLGVVIYFIVQTLKSKNVAGQAQDTPLDILKRRYAKGEITKEEFDRTKKEVE